MTPGLSDDACVTSRLTLAWKICLFQQARREASTATADADGKTARTRASVTASYDEVRRAFVAWQPDKGRAQ
ncbi:hypothetical protein AMST5_02156 [freshwater sediment metagenome]|uniref:Uncharacterized protein n=1 Tax=freshwater sediment metagenome TaxID=556182 RepID=A0AA48RDB9_9ZZZZ